MFSLILEPHNTQYPGSSLIYTARADGATFNSPSLQGKVEHVLER